MVAFESVDSRFEKFGIMHIVHLWGVSMGGGSKGSGKKSIRSLTRKHATHEEANAVLNSAQINLSPVACAILMTAMVEQELEHALRAKLPRKDDETWDLLTTSSSTFDTFTRKIDLGYALKMYDKEFRANLITLKSVRNGFAHAKMLIDFDNEHIVEQLKTITFPKVKNKERKMLVEKVQKNATKSPRDSFLWLVALTFGGLGKRRLRGAKISASKKKLSATKARAFVLAERLRAYKPGRDFLGGFDLGSGPMSPDYRPPDPKSRSGQGLLYRPLGATPNRSDNEDK